MTLQDEITSLYKAIGSEIDEFEQITGGEIYFGRRAGSSVQGLNSAASDVDLHLFGSASPEYKHNEAIKFDRDVIGGGNIYDYELNVDDEVVLLDVDFIFMDEVYRKITEFEDKALTKFPSKYYRSEEEHQELSGNYLGKVFRIRSDYELWMHQQFLGSDYLWLKKYEYVDLLQEQYRKRKTIDILDAYFSRADGNYEHHFAQKTNVVARKYLYALHQILTFLWIADKKSLPPMLFESLLSGSGLKEDIVNRIRTVWNLNSKTTIYKTKYEIPADDSINNFIKENILLMKEKIENYDTNESYFEILKNTPREERPKVYLGDQNVWIDILDGI